MLIILTKLHFKKMKNTNIFLVLITLIIPSFCFADWFQIFSTNSGDLFINTDSIKREKNRVFFQQLVNYKNKQPNGMRSLKTFSEINCENLQVRDIGYETFKKNMGYGKNFYVGKPKKNWKKVRQGTSAHFLNKILCDRVYP